MSALTFRVTPELVRRFAELTGDWSSLHTDPSFGARCMYGHTVVHGLSQIVFASAWPALIVPRRECLEYRRLTARFAQPVVPGEVMTLRLDDAPAEEGGNTDVEFDVRREGSDVVTTNGSLRFGPARPGRGPRPRGDEGAEPTPMVSDELHESAWRFEDIVKGTTVQFRARLATQHARRLFDLLELGLVSPMSFDFDAWMSSADPSNLLAATLCSTVIGMSLPGRFAVLTDLNLTFTDAMEWGREYDVVTTVVFKTPTTWTVVATVAFREPASSVPIATGRLSARFDIEHARRSG